ncbi:MAG: hypothetical protein GX591_05835 [Planctomycetes bacterium]|nr:hypothetical protein [Planctomycetota bacterium]
MKNATEYGKKVKAFLPTLKKQYPADPHRPVSDPLGLFVLAVLRENAPADAAARNLEVLRNEFVDYNELRVAPVKDVVELLEGDPVALRTKALRITEGLNRIFDQNNKLDLEHTTDMGKRDLRAHLSEALGLTSYVEAYLLTHLFDHRAIPVDDSLVERLKAEDLAGGDAGVDDVRVLLERVVPTKDQDEMAEILAAWTHDPKAHAAKAGTGGGAVEKKAASGRKSTGKAARKTTSGKTASKKKKTETTTKRAAARKTAKTKKKTRRQ